MQGALPLSLFQFHKGAIRTDDAPDADEGAIISIP